MRLFIIIFFFILIFPSFSIFCLFFIPSIYCFNLNDCIPMSPSDDMPTFGRLSPLAITLIKPTLTHHPSIDDRCTNSRYFHFVSTHTIITYLYGVLAITVFENILYVLLTCTTYLFDYYLRNRYYSITLSIHANSI